MSNIELNEIAEHLDKILTSEEFLRAWDSMKNLSDKSKSNLRMTCACYFYFGMQTALKNFDAIQNIWRK